MKNKRKTIVTVAFTLCFLTCNAQNTVNTEQDPVKKSETESSPLKIENHNTTRSYRRKNDPTISSRRKEKKSKH